MAAPAGAWGARTIPVLELHTYLLQDDTLQAIRNNGHVFQQCIAQRILAHHIPAILTSIGGNNFGLQ